MPQKIIIDFETFYDSKAGYSLRKMTVPEYILDRRFKVFGMAVDMGGKQDFIVGDANIRKFLKAHANDILVAHNAFFDKGILAWHYKFKPAWMVCTLLLANHVLGSAREQGSKNDLANLAEKLGLPEQKGKLAFMDGVSDPDEGQLAALGVYARTDARLARQVLNILWPQVTNPEFELWLLDHTLGIYTDKFLAIDAEKLARTRKMLVKRRQEMVAASGVDAKLLNSNKQFAEEVFKRLKAAKLKVPMKRAKPRKDGSTPMIPALAKTDPQFIALADSSVQAVADLVKGRLVERSAVTIAARLATMQRYIDLGIGIPVHLVYYGAHTGRFSGGGGFNFQNLTSPARATDPWEREVAALIREIIEAGPGLVFVPVDAAQIEARVLAWLAGEDQITEAFARGADLYSEFISTALGEDIHKPTDADAKDKHPYLKLMRQVGKEAVLGLGYSMGNDKFRERLRREKNIVPMLEPKALLNEDKTKEIVTAYRDTYTRIPEFWDDLNRAFTAAISGAVRRVGKLTFRKHAPKVVTIELPSGRKLYYRNLRQEAETTPNGGTRKVWKHGAGQRIYGGLLAENVTQAVARDILAESILAAEQAGYPVVLHVHDEIVCRVPEVQGPMVLEFLIKSLSTPPEWGEGLVLSAEGHVAKNLSK